MAGIWRFRAATRKTRKKPNLWGRDEDLLFQCNTPATAAKLGEFFCRYGFTDAIYRFFPLCHGFVAAKGQFSKQPSTLPPFTPNGMWELLKGRSARLPQALSTSTIRPRRWNWSILDNPCGCPLAQADGGWRYAQAEARHRIVDVWLDERGLANTQRMAAGIIRTIVSSGWRCIWK
jgi:hypothetical protein